MFYAVISALCLLFCSLGQKLPAKSLSVSVNAESAILINAKTGDILYEKNIHEPQFPASITKIASALFALTLKGDKLEEEVTAEQEALASMPESAIRRSNFTLPSHYVEQGSSHIGIKKGEILKFRDLFYGMLLVSGNDASNVIAQYSAGSIPKFIEEMNKYLKTIGCKNTNFCNPHGLHNPKHRTTAYDMALIAKEALKQPFFAEVVKTVRFTRPKTNKQEASTLVQFNKLLRTGRYQYSKATGIKTGYTSFALNTFVGAASNGERSLIVVLLKSKERSDIFTDSIKLFEAAFNEGKVTRKLITAGHQTFALTHESATKPIQTYASNDFTLEYYPSEEPEVKSYLKWDNVKLPVKKGTKVGELIISNLTAKTNDKVALFAEEDVDAGWFSWFRS